ncbi:hypothetical protein ON010_g14079 [Phytophthora cinnamomi]|nr:hypothetical protein ON010_g14079 [Phytophthora cinnamomi]
MSSSLPGKVAITNTMFLLGSKNIRIMKEKTRLHRCLPTAVPGCSPSRGSVSKRQLPSVIAAALQDPNESLPLAESGVVPPALIANQMPLQLFVWTNGSEGRPGWPATTGAERRATTHTQLENTAVKANMVSEEA